MDGLHSTFPYRCGRMDEMQSIIDEMREKVCLLHYCYQKLMITTLIITVLKY